MYIFESRLRGVLVPVLCAAALLAAPRALAAPADSTSLPITFHTRPLAPCDGDTVALAAVNACYPCFDITSFGRAADGHLRLDVTQRPDNICQTAQCQPQERAVRLGVLAAGHHLVDVEIAWHLPADSTNGGDSTIVLHRLVAFDVGRCPPGELPFVEHVLIGGPAPCDTCMFDACPDAPIPVGLQGSLPNHCWSLLGFELLPLMSPMDRPVARLTVREPNPLVDLDCQNVPVPFSVGTSLPPASPGLHELQIQVAIRGWEDSTSLQIHAKDFVFLVLDSCATPPPTACVWPFLEPRRPVLADTLPDTTSRCDLRLMPGERGPIFFAARAQVVPLAGLQGEIYASPLLKVVNLEAVGAAQGMQLGWIPKANGASYVLYSGTGAPIPADTWAPVLLVTVQADSGITGVAHGTVHGLVRAASDASGTSVPLCPVMTLVLPAANVCIGERQGCDANRDGLANVADLVRIARCLLEPAWCPDTIAARPDCTGDGAFHADDIICCARTILGAPADGIRDPGPLQFSFGEPVMLGPILRVPLRVQGAGDVSGALLRLDYPSDRWIAVDDALAGGDPLSASAAGAWTPFVEPGPDDVLVGLLRLDPTAPSELSVTLAFSLRPGAEPGGELRVGASEIMAGDGTPIALDLGALSARLEPAGPVPVTRVALSPARPNPSSGATSFVVSLPAAGNVDLAMYDLAGRRVATLWRGPLAAGNREFTWRPDRAPSGIYFARLVVDGETRSSRVTFKPAR